jgi:hypothetical protein
LVYNPRAMIGRKLAQYEIESKLGVGGMGEVYLARDLRLGRSVAVKVLPEAFAKDEERIARFEREAKALAALNHANIAALHGFEQAGDTRFLVMELVEGETLAERIRRGPLPIDEALKIALQIAEALEAAHEKGIVHRDLKPANVKVTPDGKVKVLDFGLAKAMESGPVNTSLSNSPTLSVMATNPGIILGTAAYMSPEQAKGRPVDARTDVFSFGCVLYEMLTGRPAFEGEDVTEILSRVLQREPDWSLLPADIPDSMRRLLRRCLQKDRRRRLHAAADMRIEIEEGGAEPKREEVRAAGGSFRVLWMGSGLLLVAVAVLAVLYFQQRPSKPAEMRLEIATPPTNDPGSLAITPDGTKIVFVGTDATQSQLWIRSLNSDTAQPVSGTTGADMPFWSPDSQSIGFFALGNLKRVDLVGGPPQTLATAAGLGGMWVDGAIFYVPQNFAPLMRIPASGGPATAVTKEPPTGSVYYSPTLLPDRRHYLIGSSGPQGAGVYFASIDSPEPQFLQPTDNYSLAQYLRSGWLLYLLQGSLLARRFDPASGKLSGDPVALAARIENFSVSDDGVIIYRRSVELARSHLVWTDRTGKPAGAMNSPDPRIALANPELSPDEKRVAGDVTLDGNRDVWLLDSVRAARFTFDAGGDWMPIWSPDGKSIVFRSNRSKYFKLYEKASDGSGSETLLLDNTQGAMPDSWSRDGRFLLYQAFDDVGGRDLWVFPFEGDRKPFVFLKTKFNEAYGQFSPDGKWVAYESNESGRTEVYIRPFPAAAGQWQVSTAGGSQARWRADGKELYFVAPDQKLMAAAVTPNGTAVAVGAPVPLFTTHLLGGGSSGYHQQYAVSKDGRFLLTSTPEETGSSSIGLILNWRPPGE